MSRATYRQVSGCARLGLFARSGASAGALRLTEIDRHSVNEYLPVDIPILNALAVHMTVDQQ
jgi:hypothetical protein